VRDCGRAVAKARHRLGDRRSAEQRREAGIDERSGKPALPVLEGRLHILDCPPAQTHLAGLGVSHLRHHSGCAGAPVWQLLVGAQPASRADD